VRHARPTTPRPRRHRAAVVALTAGLLVATAAGTASAKEIGSGGTPTPTTCNPVSSLSYKGDATTSDTGAASIAVSYSVKPCIQNQSVTVDTRLYLNADPSQVSYDNPAAPLSGKFTVFGITANTSYIVKVSVYDAATGELAGSKSIFAAAVYKGV